MLIQNGGHEVRENIKQSLFSVYVSTKVKYNDTITISKSYFEAKIAKQITISLTRIMFSTVLETRFERYVFYKQTEI